MTEEKTVDRSQEVSDMLDNIIAGNNAEAQQQFNDQMQSRTNDALDQLKQDTAAVSYTHLTLPTILLV